MGDTNERILTALASMTEENENLVVAKKEILDVLDNDIGVEELDKRLEALEVNDMIVVRYSDAENYCLALRPKGRINAERIQKEQIAAAMADAEAREVTEGTFLPPVPAEEEEETTEEIPKEVHEVVTVQKIPWKILFGVCAGSAFVGGMLAAIVAFLIAKFA